MSTIKIPDLRPRRVRWALRAVYGFTAAVAVVALIVGGAAYVGCTTDETSARNTLEAEGYRDIKITGRSWLACAQDDDTCTGFQATGPSGVRVSGAVGCGYWGCTKGCTIRISH